MTYRTVTIHWQTDSAGRPHRYQPAITAGHFPIIALWWTSTPFEGSSTRWGERTTADVVGPKLYRSRRHARRIAQREAHRRNREADRFGQNAMRIGP